ncbi:MAG: DUF3494 domain-containing protein [Balneolaceae bacterium]|nr:DUF3494 domain-containing protein [Balneolaceae bacterium]
MRSKKITHFSTSLSALFLAVFMIGSANQSSMIQDRPANDEPTVVSTSPSDGEVNVARNIVIEITFSEDIDTSSMNGSSFTLMQGTESVSGTLDFYGKKATYTTTNSLKADSEYTANFTIGSNEPDVNHPNNEFNDEQYEEFEENYDAHNNGKQWSFTTGGNSDSVEKVDLGSAADYVILAQSSIHNDSSSKITGERGFDADKKDSKGSKENKTAYWLNNEDVDKEAVRRDRDAARRDTTREMNEERENPATERSAALNNQDGAVEDMITAYNDAAGRSPADFIDFKFSKSDDQTRSARDYDRDYDRTDENEFNQADSTEVEMNEHHDYERDTETSWTERDTNGSSTTLEPGIYTWNESVEIYTNITLSGNADDVWIFQIPADLTVNRDVEFTLTDGAVAENIFWQVGGEVSLGESSHFEGIILSLTGITMKNGASLNGRMLTQTDVTLDDNTIIEPKLLTTIQGTSSNE